MTDLSWSDFKENNIEFFSNSGTVSCYFTQGRFITKIRKLAEKYPDECGIDCENKDGSIVAHFPVKWLHITRYESNLTEEQRIESGKRLKAWRETLNNQS